MLHMMLQAPRILYMVTMATFTVTNNRVCLDTFPLGAALLTNRAGAPQWSNELWRRRASGVLICTSCVKKYRYIKLLWHTVSLHYMSYKRCIIIHKTGFFNQKKNICKLVNLCGGTVMANYCHIEIPKYAAMFFAGIHSGGFYWLHYRKSLILLNICLHFGVSAVKEAILQ